MPRHLFAQRLVCFRNGKRGFTLIELLIVGALIALFSGLAVISIQQVFNSNVRKATIGETRQIATALEFANLDTSIFPRLSWLTQSPEGMRLIGSQIGVGDAIFTRLDMNGRLTGTAGANRLFNQWDGPYFAMATSRAGTAQGRGGFVFMLFPDLPSSGPNSIGGSGGIRWPADPYNNPYVVYMLDINFQNGQLSFVSDEAVGNQPATRKGNYINAVVSYGPNNYPGGTEFNREPFEGPDQLTIGPGPYALRLYRGRPDYRPPTKGVVTHTYLTQNELNIPRANAWSRDFFGNVPAGNQPQDENGNPVGITDPGSDDIVFEF